MVLAPVTVISVGVAIQMAVINVVGVVLPMTVISVVIAMPSAVMNILRTVISATVMLSVALWARSMMTGISATGLMMVVFMVF